MTKLHREFDFYTVIVYLVSKRVKQRMISRTPRLNDNKFVNIIELDYALFGCVKTKIRRYKDFIAGEITHQSSILFFLQICSFFVRCVFRQIPELERLHASCRKNFALGIFYKANYCGEKMKVVFLGEGVILALTSIWLLHQMLTMMKTIFNQDPQIFLNFISACLILLLEFSNKIHTKCST